MSSYEDMFVKLSKKNAEGTLTIGEALIGSYYRLIEGIYAGKVVIKACDKIGGREIVRFANGLTWVELEKIKDTRCEVTYPTFAPPTGKVDISQCCWYSDGSNELFYPTW